MFVFCVSVPSRVRDLPALDKRLLSNGREERGHLSFCDGWALAPLSGDPPLTQPALPFRGRVLLRFGRALTPVGDPLIKARRGDAFAATEIDNGEVAAAVPLHPSLPKFTAGGIGRSRHRWLRVHEKQTQEPTAPQTHASAERLPKAREKQYEAELTRMRYHQTRNASASRSHQKTRLAEYDALGIDPSKIKSVQRKPS